MFARLFEAQKRLDTYNDHIQRLLDMIKHIQNSNKLKEWGAVTQEASVNKPRFDLVVTQLRHFTVLQIKS